MVCSLLGAALVSAVPAAAAYTPDWESLRRHQTPEWFRDAKFGLYFHWSLYSVPEFENEWYSRNMYQKGSTANRHHVQTYGEVSKFGYKDFIPQFTAEKFDPAEWADLFVKAGARFAGPVAEHADGFSLWDSKLTRWNAAKMGPKRDIVGDLSQAIKARGLKFVTTFHHQWLWGWYPTDDASADASNPEYAGLYGPRVPATAFDYANPRPRPDAAFCGLWRDKVLEVIDKYQPDLVYFDSRMAIIDEKYRQAWAAQKPALLAAQEALKAKYAGRKESVPFAASNQIDRQFAAQVPRPPFESLIAHFDHIIRVAGIDHVGIGSDFDGISALPEDIDSAADLPKITEALLARGHSAEDLQKVLGGNLMRVFRAIQAIS